MSRKSCLFRKRMLQASQITTPNHKGILVRQQHPMMVSPQLLDRIKAGLSYKSMTKMERRFRAAFPGKKV